MKNQNHQADLHNHTTASDGALTPEELVDYAAELGIEVLGITDHDTVDGLQEAITASHHHNLEILAGVEITIRFSEPFFRGSLHLLAYFPEDLLSDARFLNESDSVLSMGRGKALTSTRIYAINEWFAPGKTEPLMPRELTETDVYAHGDRISRRHFALALNAMGITEKSTVNRIISNDSPAYIPSGSPLSVLKDYVGRWPFVLVLAHPAAGSFPGETLYREVLPPFETVERLLPRFLELGLAGLEIEYPGHTTEWKARLRQYALEKGLTVQTGGSDCHDRENRPLGLCGVSLADVAGIRARFGTVRQ